MEFYYSCNVVWSSVLGGQHHQGGEYTGAPMLSTSHCVRSCTKFSGLLLDSNLGKHQSLGRAATLDRKSCDACCSLIL